MTTHRFAAILATTVLIACNALAEEAPPKLALSKAAKLAEDAIAAASLPADHYLRSISLIETPDAPAFYQAAYKPPTRRRIKVGEEPPPTIIEFIRITMDGKVSFEQEEITPRRIRVR